MNLYCKDPEDRKDLAQEITTQIWLSFDSYNPQYKYSTWIYRIALNKAISFYHQEKKRTAGNTPIELIPNLFEEPPDTEQDDRLKALRSFINDLKALDKALMILYLDEKTYKEISLIMGLTETNVSTRLNRIKNHLKERFSQQKN